MTLFNPPIFQFYPCTKTSERVFRNFSSSNSSKFRKIHSEIRIQGKNNFGKRVPKFKIRGKNGNPGGKKSHGGWDENLSTQTIQHNIDDFFKQLGFIPIHQIKERKKNENEWYIIFRFPF
jgi:hypothetical protein